MLELALGMLALAAPQTDAIALDDGAEAGPQCIVHEYLVALESTMQVDSKMADLDEVTALLSEGAVYRHPRFKMEIEGRDEIGSGMGRFLGTMREGQIEVSSFTIRDNVVVVNYRRNFETGEPGKEVEQSIDQTTVFEIGDGRITGITDFW